MKDHIEFPHKERFERMVNDPDAYFAEARERARAQLKMGAAHLAAEDPTEVPDRPACLAPLPLGSQGSRRLHYLWATAMTWPEAFLGAVVAIAAAAVVLSFFWMIAHSEATEPEMPLEKVARLRPAQVPSQPTYTVRWWPPRTTAAKSQDQEAPK